VEAVTTVLLERAREPGGLRNTVGVSLLLHVGVAALVVLGPVLWHPERDDRPKTTMTITLGGGTSGPMSGGANPIGGRPVQTTEPANPKRPEAARPPAVKAPEMIMPAPASKKAPAPKVQPKTAPNGAIWGTPARGSEVRPGSAVAETGAKGMGWGLSTGGGGGTGSYLEISGDFCCPEYITTMLARIERNWQGRQGVRADAMVKFTILRSGTITDVELERKSGYPMLDIAAQRALYLTSKQLPPLPDAFTESHLTVHLLFEYK
jgi:TonB family protein